MTAPNLDEIARRYSAALNAKPSKGEWTQRGIDALTDSVSDVGGLLDEVQRLHTWDGLMSLLDEHWPESLFPTLADDESRDAGARIVSLIRWVQQQRRDVEIACGAEASADAWAQRAHAAEAERDALGEAAFAAVMNTDQDKDGAQTWEQFFRPLKRPSWRDVVKDGVQELRRDRDDSDTALDKILDQVRRWARDGQPDDVLGAIAEIVNAWDAS
ncbi:hypothetical protein [Isoptericola sp. NPDC056134]|uniref:hypothetical protein n=1 Tax=Isoptericola sp. NPDC056134 TaxID=3345723 RepID=UPI0035E8FF2F